MPQAVGAGARLGLVLAVFSLLVVWPVRQFQGQASDSVLNSNLTFGVQAAPASLLRLKVKLKISTRTLISYTQFIVGGRIARPANPGPGRCGTAGPAGKRLPRRPAGQTKRLGGSAAAGRR